MNYNYILVVVMAVCIFISILSVNKLRANIAESEGAAIINEFIKNHQGKISDPDKSFENNEGNFSAGDNAFRQTTKTVDNGSKIDAMFDRYGNKTETRCFNFHPRLRCVVLSTSAEGRLQFYVYGQNGDVKGLPEGTSGSIMLAPADDIANLAELPANMPRMSSPVFIQKNQTGAVASTIPKPANQSPVQNPVAEQSITEETTELTKDNAAKTPSEKQNTQLTENKETNNLNPKPEDRD